AGVLAYWQGDDSAAVPLLEQSVALYRAAGDQDGLIFALNNLGMAVAEGGDLERATELFEEGLALDRAVQVPLRVAMQATNLTTLALAAGDLDLAQARSEEALALGRQADELLTQATCLNVQALIACRRGQPERAATSARQAQELFWEAG